VETEVFLIVLGAWNLSLSYLLWRIAREIRRVNKDIKPSKLKKINKNIENLQISLDRLNDQSQFYFQKASLVKFNPFSELGGEQSFSLALLDENNQGIVLTSLHGRQATRIYTKLVGDDKVKLSDEEKKAIKEATKKKK
jgi:hypothetical protein